MKNIKQSWIMANTRREWLRRNEDGEKPPQIAETEGYDVRTVRKHIDIARQEREVKEARTAVLRNALERHYQDLYEFIKSIDSQIRAQNAVTLSDKAPLFIALKQHMPRSFLWKLLPKWNAIIEELQKKEDSYKEYLLSSIGEEGRLKDIKPEGADGVLQGVAQALAFQVRAWIRGWKGLNIDADIHLGDDHPASIEPGQVIIRYGAFRIGLINKDDSPVIVAVLQNWESKIKDDEQFKELGKTYKRVLTLQDSILEDLTIVLMRRIVTGRCKYCPI